ncbi:MAG TPA: DUF488 domain-containing protein [Thermoanaerobaculia bacterium]|nr:DUF488 domain-containing protein [Thermoanaerobaculia bacterium]
MTSDILNRIATVGHSNRPLDDFLRIVRAHGVGRIADVRRYPTSRRWPHFSAVSLAESLPAAGIDYEPMPELGGRRKARPDSPHTAWRVEAFRGYADFMDTPEFRDALARLEELARARFTAVMCAEALPWRCHRSLIADSLLARGWQVLEILSEREARPRVLPDFARLDGDRVVYDSAQGKLL